MHSAVALLPTGPESIVGRFRRPVKSDQVVRRDDLLWYPTFGVRASGHSPAPHGGRLLQTY